MLGGCPGLGFGRSRESIGGVLIKIENHVVIARKINDLF